MKKAQYLFITFLLVITVFLVACGVDASAAPADLIDITAVEESTTIEEPAANIENDVIPESSVDDSVQSSEPAPVEQANGYGNGPADPDRGEHIIPEGDLSEGEIVALQYMREEEKLARDLYQAMYDLWGAPIFGNIAGSEQAHMDSIAYLLDAYDVPDPAADKAPGQFSDPELQALYNELVDQGQASLEEALRVGGAVEEIDIVDLQERLAETSNESVKQVFENLLAGSVNHLQAYSMNLERQTGTAYQLRYLSQEAYKELLGTTSERGYGPGSSANDGRGGRGAGGNGNGQGQGGNGQGGNGQGGNGRGRGN